MKELDNLKEIIDNVKIDNEGNWFVLKYYNLKFLIYAEYINLIVNNDKHSSFCLKDDLEKDLQQIKILFNTVQELNQWQAYYGPLKDDIISNYNLIKEYIGLIKKN